MHSPAATHLPQTPTAMLIDVDGEVVAAHPREAAPTSPASPCPTRANQASPPAYARSLPPNPRIFAPFASSPEPEAPLLPSCRPRQTPAPQASWLPAWPSALRREVQEQVCRLLQQAQQTQSKGGVDQALLVYEAADKACANARLSYRTNFFVDIPGRHLDPLVSAASGRDNQPVLLALLRIAPKAHHVLWGSLLAKDAVYDQRIRAWVRAKGTSCRHMLLAGRDEAACAEIVELDEVLGAVRAVEPRWCANTSLCGFLSPHVSAIEVAKRRDCSAAAELLRVRDPVGLRACQDAAFDVAAQSLEMGDVDAAEQLYGELVAHSGEKVPVLLAEPRVEQFVRSLFAAEAVRLVIKTWSEEHKQVLDAGSKQCRTQVSTVVYEKRALAIDVEHDSATTQRWLQLALKFGMNTGRLTFGHTDFLDRQNVRFWFERGSKNGMDLTHADPQLGENATADARTSLLHLLRRAGAFAAVAVSSVGSVDGKLIETVRTGLQDVVTRRDLCAYLQQVRARQPDDGAKFLSLLLDPQLQDMLPAEVRAWVERT